MDSVSGSDERAAGKLAATLKYIDEASEIEFGNLILAESFERISMYRGAMEPTQKKQQIKRNQLGQSVQ